MSKLKQKKIYVNFHHDKLKNTRTGETYTGDTYIVKYDDFNLFESKELGKPKLGYNVFIDNGLIFWLTTTITEILEESEYYVKFKTQNSTYEWRDRNFIENIL